MTLPADVPTSLVQGTYSIAEADNADTGIEPQGAPLDGLQIVLTPDPPRVWTHTSSGAGVAIGPMLATTNSLGVLVNPVTGLVGLRIPSSAQAGLTGAPTIPWTAEISDPLGRVETERKTFHAPADGTVNLPSVAPYWPDPNAGSIPQWEAAAADARAAIDTYAPAKVDALVAAAGITRSTQGGTRVWIGGTLVHASTGMRSIAALVNLSVPGYGDFNFSRFNISREGNRVTLSFVARSVPNTTSMGWGHVLVSLPTGFTPTGGAYDFLHNEMTQRGNLLVRPNGDVYISSVASSWVSLQMTWETSDAWRVTDYGVAI